MRPADGSWVWVHDTTTPVRDEHGRVTHFQGFMIDVTGRHAAEAAVVDAEARYRAVVERLPAVELRRRARRAHRASRRACPT